MKARTFLSCPVSSHGPRGPPVGHLWACLNFGLRAFSRLHQHDFFRPGNVRPIRPTSQGPFTNCLMGWWWIRPSPLFRSVFAGGHHHHHGRRRHLRRRSHLLAAPVSPPSTHDQRDLRFLPAAAASRHHLPRAVRPLPAVRAGIGAGAGGQPQVPQREGGRGRRGSGRGGAPAAVHVAGVARGRHGGDQAAAEARGRAGQAQAQGPVRGSEVPPEAFQRSVSVR
ncbi:hypothetical protein C2845_PM13G01690 [Panicum miliaceum]|uniref:Uncharacterized protein n=1 Tax=Panicum miliaceum TaxID=4540 RepID=A0A3L6RLS4_PANMI|nr:hypothetical protein C2845_PM13G01690 [Panicum miliaceum]